MRSLAYALLSLALVVPGFALAQSIGGVGPAPLTLDLQPQYPRPYDTITVTPGSSNIDLTGAQISFYVNGKLLSTSTGTAPASVVLGAPGTATTIKVTAITAGGGSYSVSQTISPAEVELIAEPTSTSHPFYQGGLGIPSYGQVRLVALPDLRTSTGKRYADSALIYNWKLNGQALTDASGIGRSVINITAPVRYRDATLEVIATSPDQSRVAEANMIISPVDPLVRIYENDPLLGIRYDQAVGTDFTLPGTEDTFMAVPYYFAQTPALSWSVDGKAGGSDPAITLRATGSGGGSASVSVTADLSQLFSTATQAVRVTFGASSGGTGIFGL
jgi:hypothetical protein